MGPPIQRHDYANEPYPHQPQPHLWQGPSQSFHPGTYSAGPSMSQYHTPPMAYGHGDVYYLYPPHPYPTPQYQQASYPDNWLPPNVVSPSYPNNPQAHDQSSNQKDGASKATRKNGRHNHKEPKSTPRGKTKGEESDSPVERTPYVMWMGNLPKKVSSEELQEFFRKHPLPNGSDPEIVSFFLISHSNCAFVNFKTQEKLDQAIDRYNNTQFRPGDPRCPFLICRARMPEDEEKAGVGGQRSASIHRDWVRMNGESVSHPVMKESETDDLVEPPSLDASPDLAPRGPFEADEKLGKEVPNHTTSSFLEKYFPVRYFVLKSLTRAGLEESVKTGTWTTQWHNEEILDRAFRTSNDVYLIFSENKSGGFYGYAKMKGKIFKTERPERPRRNSFLNETRPSNRMVTSSPQALEDPTPSTGDAYRPGACRTAPPVMASSYFEFEPRPSPAPSASFSAAYDDEALSFASALKSTSPPDLSLPWMDGREEDTLWPPENLKSPFAAGAVTEASSQGRPFEIEWIKVKRLPFSRTKHIKNIWNDNREVKISRDGTEIDPVAGARLLDEWDKLEEDVRRRNLKMRNRSRKSEA